MRFLSCSGYGLQLSSSGYTNNNNRILIITTRIAMGNSMEQSRESILNETKRCEIMKTGKKNYFHFIPK